MKWWLIPLIIILAFVQTTITDFDFLLFLVLTVAMIAGEKESLFLAFISGLLFDLLAGTKLGITSIAYLISVMVIILYKRKFLTANFWFWLVIFQLSGFLTKTIQGMRWHWWQAVTITILVAIIFWVVQRIDLAGLAQDEEGIKLKV